MLTLRRTKTEWDECVYGDMRSILRWATIEMSQRVNETRG
jgi:hypothetical protein